MVEVTVSSTKSHVIFTAAEIDAQISDQICDPFATTKAPGKRVGPWPVDFLQYRDGLWRRLDRREPQGRERCIFRFCSNPLFQKE